MGEVKKIKQGKLTFYYGIEQGTQEWLELRANRATCSNALAVGHRDVKAAIEINRQHAERKTPNGNQYAERGHVLEDEIRSLLEQHFNNDEHELKYCSFITNDDYPLAGYSPDGIITDRKTGEFIAPIEVKCFNDTVTTIDRWTSKEVTTEKNKHARCCQDVHNIPFENRMQFEMEMLMTGTSQLIVVLYNPDADIAAGVPVLKIHTYTPEMFHDENGDEYPAYQKTLAERLNGKAD